ncbi:hypothetical protein G9A89_007133 [Geosiphon pyriformis]|nr:hypothetical protein G9A89_007133 [Geosiphon pyriformis]
MSSENNSSNIPLNFNNEEKGQRLSIDSRISSSSKTSSILKKSSTLKQKLQALPILKIQSPTPLSANILPAKKLAITTTPTNILFSQNSEPAEDLYADYHNKQEAGSIYEENIDITQDFCFPASSAPSEAKSGIDFEALEKYANEENIKWQESDTLRDEINFGNTILSPPILLSPTISRNSSYKKRIQKRKMSLYGDRARLPGEDLSDKLRFTFYSVERGAIQAHSFFELPPEETSFENLLKQGVFWINVLAPSDSEMKMLSKIFNIHPLTMEDIAMEESREKCDLFRTYYFICFRSFVQDQNSPNFLQPVNIYNVVMKEGILTFHFKQAPHASNVRERIRHLRDFIKVTPDWINYAILDDITDSFAPLVRKVEVETDTMDELVLILRQTEQSDMLRRIGHNRKVVMSLLRLLGSKADVIKGLIKRCEEKVLATGGDRGEVKLYLHDIQDHIITMVQNINHCENILGRSHSTYLAQISIEITQLSNKTNDAIGKLSVFATILLPSTLIAGIFGMNVKVPGDDQDDLVWFFWIVGLMIFIGVVGMIQAKRRGLI